MQRPPARIAERYPFRSLFASLVAASLSALLLVTPAAAQQPQTGFSPLVEAIGAMLITLVIGGGLILLAPEYTERTTQRALDQPANALLYGVGIGILIAIALVILIVTVVGILVAIPLALVVLVFSELGYLAAGRAVTDNWGGVLLVAMGLSAIVGGLPILGALLGLILSSLGIGAAYLYYRGGDDSPSNRRT